MIAFLHFFTPGMPLTLSYSTATPQVVVVYAATKGYLDKVAVSDITTAEAAILKHVNPAVYKVLKANSKINPALNQHLHLQLTQVPLPIKNA